MSDFVEAMSAVASTVVIVTCEVQGRPWGMTVTAFCPVSAEPPTVLVSLGSETAAARAIVRTGRFGVSVLREGHQAVARHGARPGEDKYLDGLVDARAGYSASPAIADAVAHLDCEVIHRDRVADHLLVVGRVRAARSSDGEGSPLLYHRRAYSRLEPAA